MVSSFLVEDLRNALFKAYPWVKWQTQVASQSVDCVYIYSDVFAKDVNPPDGGNVSGVDFTTKRLPESYPIKVYGLVSKKIFRVNTPDDWSNHFAHFLYRHDELDLIRKSYI